MRFYLGTHKQGWINKPEFADIPLFVSHRALRQAVRGFKSTTTPLAVDSGGFTELQKYGRWMTGAQEYVDALRGYRDQTGSLVWSAPQDWMCEDVVIDGGTHAGIRFAGTGLSVAEHQERTVASVLELRALAPELHIIPVLQGQSLDSYLKCAELYASSGIDLRAEPVVGLGSVCRREATDEVGALARELHQQGYALHGFGVKAAGLRAYGEYLASADSLAWSFLARRDGHHRRKRGLPASRLGCQHGVTKDGCCNNCPTFALDWRARLLAGLGSTT